MASKGILQEHRDVLLLDTGIGYAVTLNGKKPNFAHPMKKAHQVFVSRLLVVPRQGKSLPSFEQARSIFQNCLSQADSSTKSLLTIGRNAHGQLLVELPDHPKNRSAFSLFLEGLEAAMANRKGIPTA